MVTLNFFSPFGLMGHDNTYLRGLWKAFMIARICIEGCEDSCYLSVLIVRNKNRFCAAVNISSDISNSLAMWFIITFLVEAYSYLGWASLKSKPGTEI